MIALSFGQSNLAFSDAIETSGGGNGTASGSTDQSSSASFYSGSESEAESVGQHSGSGGSSAWVETSVEQSSSAGNNSVDVYSGSGASVNSNNHNAEASAGAIASGSAGNIGTDGSVGAEAKISADGLSANAVASNGSFAHASTVKGVAASTFVPNGTTQTKSHGRVQISISIAADGSYAFAKASRRGVSATVGVTTDVKLTNASIKDLLRSVLFATASANKNGVSASASAAIDGAASNLAAQAHASGFSSATAKVTFFKGTKTAVITLSSGSQCVESRRAHAKRYQECREIRRVINLSSAGFHSAKRPNKYLSK